VKKLFAISMLLCSALVYAADTCNSKKPEDLNKIFIFNAVARLRQGGWTNEYGEYHFDSKGNPSELLRIHSGDTRYECYSHSMRSITSSTTAEELTKSIQDSGPLGWKKMVAHLYCDGNKARPQDLIVTHSPLEFWPKGKEVWKIRKNATKWAIVHFAPETPVKSTVPKALRMAREGRKFIQTTESAYKKVDQEATERYHGNKDLSDWTQI